MLVGKFFPLLLFLLVLGSSFARSDDGDMAIQGRVWEALDREDVIAASKLLEEWSAHLSEEERAGWKASSLSPAFHDGDDENGDPYAKYDRRVAMLQHFCQVKHGVSPEHTFEMVYKITSEGSFALDSKTLGAIGEVFIVNWCDLDLVGLREEDASVQLAHIAKRWKILESREARLLAAYSIIPHVEKTPGKLRPSQVTAALRWATSVHDPGSAILRRCVIAAYYAEAGLRHRYFGIDPREIVGDPETAVAMVLETLRDETVPAGLRSAATPSIIWEPHLGTNPLVVAAALEAIDANERRYDRPVCLYDRNTVLEAIGWQATDPDSLELAIDSFIFWEARLTAASKLGYRTRLEERHIAAILKLLARAGEDGFARQIAQRHINPRPSVLRRLPRRARLDQRHHHAGSLDITLALIEIGDYDGALDSIPPEGEPFERALWEYKLGRKSLERLDEFHREHGSELLRLRLEGQIAMGMREFGPIEGIALERARALIPSLQRIGELPPLEGMRIISQMAHPALLAELEGAAAEVAQGRSLKEVFEIGERFQPLSSVPADFLAARVGIAYSNHDWEQALRLLEEFAKFGRQPGNRRQFDKIAAALPKNLCVQLIEDLQTPELHQEIAQFWKLAAEIMVDVPCDHLSRSYFTIHAALLTSNVIGKPLARNAWAQTLKGGKKTAMRNARFHEWGAVWSILYFTALANGTWAMDPSDRESKHAYFLDYLSLPGVASTDVLQDEFLKIWEQILPKETMAEIIDTPETPWVVAAYFATGVGRGRYGNPEGADWLRRIHSLMSQMSEEPTDRAERLVWKALRLSAAQIETAHGDPAVALGILDEVRWEENWKLNQLATQTRAKAKANRKR